MTHRFTTFLLALATALSARSEAYMDITLCPVSDYMEVKVRPTEDFDGFFAALTFTIRWSESTGAGLGMEQQNTQQLDVCNVNKSGPEQVSGPFRYQVFAGFGGANLSELGMMLLAGQEYTLCVIPIVNAMDAFLIVNDEFTADHNADYFVSLNGFDRTGIIYDFNTSVSGEEVHAPELLLWPNPAADVVNISADGVGSGALVEFWSLAGERLTALRTAGPLMSIPIEHLPRGTYLVRVNERSVTLTERFVH